MKFGVFGESPLFTDLNISSKAAIDDGLFVLNNSPLAFVIRGNSPLLCIAVKVLGSTFFPDLILFSYAANSLSYSPRENLRNISTAFSKFCSTPVCADVVPRTSANTSPIPPNSLRSLSLIERYQLA